MKRNHGTGHAIGYAILNNRTRIALSIDPNIPSGVSTLKIIADDLA